MPLPPVALLLALYLIPALAVSRVVSQGALIFDEMAYQFQARIFASGAMQVEAPPGATEHAADLPVALHFEHHVMDHGKWFGKYPIGWPLLFSAGMRLGAGWAVNPVLGLAILGVTFVIARRLWGRDVATLAVLLGVLSPFFLANCIERMSHPACGLFVAAATLFCFEGLRSPRLWPFVAMFLTIAAGCQVRSFTAGTAGAVLGLAALWFLRHDRRFFPVLASGVVLAALAGIGVLAWEKFYTGQYLLSPYVLSDPHRPPELDFHLKQIFENLTHQTRWGLEATVFFTFPFLFVAAGYGVWRETEFPREARILALLFPVLVIVHLAEPQINIEYSGERYYFEALFPVLILAARGIELLVRKLGTSRIVFARALAVCALAGVGQQICAAKIMLDADRPYRELRAAAERYEGSHAVIFWRDNPPLFYGKHFNLNRPDWQNEDLFYLVDPGPSARAEWACRMSRPRWVVISYDPSAGITEERGAAGNCNLSSSLTPADRYRRR